VGRSPGCCESTWPRLEKIRKEERLDRTFSGVGLNFYSFFVGVGGFFGTLVHILINLLS